MSTAKGFTLRVIGSQSVSEPFNRERGVGQGCPLAPLLFALAIEPLSRMLKQTMSGMHIDHIHVQQDTTRTVVAMCADDTTICAGGLDDIAHAKEAIQCHMDASLAPINWHKTTSFLCVATWRKTHHHQMSFVARFWDQRTRLDTWVPSSRATPMWHHGRMHSPKH